jgi:hypothetical protein
MPRKVRLAALASLLALAGGCGTLGRPQPAAADPRPSSAALDRDGTVALLLAGTIQTLQRLAQGTPATQAEIVADARQGYERSPGGSAELRYALTLATPGHDARDPKRARQMLQELAAQPETLAPVERAMTLLELSQLDRELGLQADNERLQSESERTEHDRSAASTRRLQQATEENAKLHHQLDELQAKLDAIAKIERNVTERKTTPEVPKP